MADQFPGEQGNGMMHMELIFDGIRLMGADGPPSGSGNAANSVMLNLMVDTNEQAENIFASLSEEAQHVIQPMEENFWAHRFGMLVDRYGHTWMIMHGNSEA